MIQKLLFVDMDTTTQNTFSKMLMAYPDKFEILTVGNAREVPNVVSGVKISMIIIDLKMPDVDDLEFLGYMSKNYPKIPMIVLTAFGGSEIEEKIKSFGTCRYYEKPVDIDQLMEKILDELGSSVSGQIHGISLSSFLQMSEMEKTTCKLKVRHDNETGFLYLVKGQLIDAQLGAKEGLEAAFEIISWDNTAIEIEKSGDKRKKAITMPLMNILMEGLRIKDERDALKKKAQKDTLRSTAGVRKKTAESKLESGGTEKPGQPAPAVDGKQPPVVKAKPETASEKEVLLAEKEKIIAGATAKLKRKRILAVAVSLAVTLVLAAAGGYIWKIIIKPGMVEKEYKALLADVGKLGTLEEKELLLQTYVDAYPASPYIPEVQTKIAEIRNLFQERDFQEVVAKVGKLPLDKEYKRAATNLYSTYLEKYPKGPHGDEVKQLLEQARSSLDDHEFEALKKIPQDSFEQKLSACQTYLNEFPEGRHREEVGRIMKTSGQAYYDFLKREAVECGQRREWDSCLKRLDGFIAKFKNYERLRDFTALQIEVRAEQVMWGLRTKAEKAGVGYQDARKIYMEYVEKNPNSPLADRIRAEVGILDKKIKEEEKWQEMQRLARNPEIDVFERIDLFEAYMAESAAMRYRKEAAGVLKYLEKEKEREIKQRKLKVVEELREKERAANLQKERERLEKATREFSAELSRSGGRYVVNNDGTVNDTQTGLMWYILDSQTELNACLDYESAQAYVKNLDAGGHQDWRLPTSNDLLVILNNKPYFPETGAKWYWTSESYWKGYSAAVKTVVQTRKNNWVREEEAMDKCGAARAVRP